MSALKPSVLTNDANARSHDERGRTHHKQTCFGLLVRQNKGPLTSVRLYFSLIVRCADEKGSRLRLPLAAAHLRETTIDPPRANDPRRSLHRCSNGG